MKTIRSWFSVVGLALCTLWMRKKQTFLLTALFTLLLMLLQTLLSWYGASEYTVYEMKNIWRVDEEEIYHLGMAYVTMDDVSYTERLVGYLNEAKELEQLEMLGKFYWTGIDADGRAVRLLHIDACLLGFAGVGLDRDGTDHTVYLGADFKGQYQVGDVFAKEYVVGGFLPEGMKWPTASRMLKGTDTAYGLDQNALLLNGEDQEYGLFDGLLYNQCIYFTLKEGADIEQVEQELLSLASEYNVGAYVESLKELYDNHLQENDLIRGKYRMEIMLALLVSVLTVATAQLISFWVLRSFYSVLYACGYTRSNMIAKTLIESFLIFALAAALSYVFMKLWIVPAMADEKYWYEAWHEIAVGQTMWIAAAIWALSNVLPSLYIRRQLPWNLLKEK